ncbi:MAG: hypothetical protein AB7E47_14480 [Desulfovibrionaceae bacterium]
MFARALLLVATALLLTACAMYADRPDPAAPPPAPCTTCNQGFWFIPGATPPAMRPYRQPSYSCEPQREEESGWSIF